MNRETIIQMAREAGFELDETDGYWVSFTHEIEALVALAVAKEREECAKVCDDLWQRGVPGHANDCAAAIRARGEAADPSVSTASKG